MCEFDVAYACAFWYRKRYAPTATYRFRVTSVPDNFFIRCSALSSRWGSSPRKLKWKRAKLSITETGWTQYVRIPPSPSPPPLSLSPSPHLPVSPSSRLPVSPSPHLPISPSPPVPLTQHPSPQAWLRPVVVKCYPRRDSHLSSRLTRSLSSVMRLRKLLSISGNRLCSSVTVLLETSHITTSLEGCWIHGFLIDLSCSSYPLIPGTNTNRGTLSDLRCIWMHNTVLLFVNVLLESSQVEGNVGKHETP